jgi:hypothetical protein
MSVTAAFLPLAHAAHWYFLPVYVAPVLVVLFGAVKTSRGERRKAREKTGREAKRTKRLG